MKKERGNTWRKRDIVLKIATDIGMKKIHVKRIVQILLDCIYDSLTRREAVKLENFGTFKLIKCRSRARRNPITGLTIIPAHTKVKFRLSPRMNKKINSSAR